MKFFLVFVLVVFKLLGNLLILGGGGIKKSGKK